MIVDDKPADPSSPTPSSPTPSSPTPSSPTNAEPTPDRGAEPTPFPIVGIGASAGGLEAIEAFFDQVPADSGLAFVVVQHLSPDFKSMMDELLARHTMLPIHRVTDGMPVRPNAVYLIPPKKEMILANGRLLLSDKDPEQGLTLPIDIFFRSLAQDAGSRSIAVVLSGTGSDGSRGICDIHDAGGFVVVQDRESARFDGMPKSAAETGVADLILPPAQMPAALLTYTKHPNAADWTARLPEDAALLEGIDAILQLLRKHHDIDFSHYKRTTVMRRVHRRLLMNQITDLDDYVARLREDPKELNSLYKDLLIGVTKFFRDAEAYQRLAADVLPQLLVNVRAGQELRIWVAGCATGEEAYSIAILVHEQLEALKRPLSVKIFATDVHQTSLNAASAGTFSEAALSELSPERLERYFRRTNGGLQVVPELRQMIVFAPHNIIKDAPFTKIDLVTCRNLLIYFEPTAQKKALSLFHFALNTGGVLMLGPSESPGELSDEFHALDDRWKLYRKRREKRLPADMRLPLPPAYAQTPAARGVELAASPQSPPTRALLRAYDEMLKDFAPPCLLVNEQRELVQSFSGAFAYLQWRDGRPSADVLDLILPELKLPLSTALQQTAKKQAVVEMSGISITRGDSPEHVKLTVKPIADRQLESSYFLVTFEPQQPRPLRPVGPEVAISVADISREHLLSLEQELASSRETLQATIEEMETSNEELQATNEELVASNEELQSTNEELHSVNEELYTVNAEYQKKIAELTELSADMDNLLVHTDVGVIFLDRQFCLRKFTPKFAEAFHLLPVDVGRRIDNFAHNFVDLDLLKHARQVLSDEVPFESEVRDVSGRSLFLRILPYRSKQQVQGLVLTLIDISRLRQAERGLHLMSRIFHEGVDPIVLEDMHGRIVDVNAEAVRVFGWTREELLGQRIDILIPENQRQAARELRTRCRERGGLRNVETVTRNKSGEEMPVLVTLSLLTDQSGEPVAIASVAKDITDRKRAERLHREAVTRRDQFLAMLSHELRNPLNAVLNATYLLDRLSTREFPANVHNACAIIQRQTLQMSRLLDDMRDVSRVTQGKIEMRREVVDLTPFVEDAAQALRPQLEARGQTLELENSHTPVPVEGDPARLLQILENLLTNAIKYTPPGGRIRLGLAREDGEAVLRVRDNGRGIPPHMLEAVFDLFVQLDDTLDRADGGMGLGLTLVRTLVSMHGGTVTAHSDGPHRGAEFVVRLPITTKEPPPAPDSQPSAGTLAQRILLIEDNADSREMLLAILKFDGYDVSVACDGREGLAALRTLRPDVAIVDIGLPGLNGYEVAQQVRLDPQLQHVYLIALTGYGRAEDCEAVRRAGFDVHLVKPLKPDEITRVLSLRPRISRAQGNNNPIVANPVRAYERGT